MLFTVLWRIEGQPAIGSAPAGAFPAGQWYSQPMAWALANSLATLDNTGSANVNGPASRASLAATLHAFAAYKGLDVSGRADLSRFTDSLSILPEHRDPVSWAVSAGVLTGRTDGTLDLYTEGTRAELAAIILRFLALFE
jgi:hypothetical protein